MTLEGMKIVVDCANGAAYKVTPWVLKELGAEVFVLHDKPDGSNINAGCGSLHSEVIQNAVIEQGADVGIAHDGDADRVTSATKRAGISTATRSWPFAR